jgi:CheY-like chemotaxis protein
VPADVTTRGTETVLVVEDQHEVREMASRTLALEGYRVMQAANGQEALDLLAGSNGEVALVVSDLSMPTLDGRRLGERLCGWRPGLPLLFMSEYGEEDVIRRGLLEEGHPFIQKPSRHRIWPAGCGSCSTSAAGRPRQGEAGVARRVLSAGASSSAVQISRR